MEEVEKTETKGPTQEEFEALQEGKLTVCPGNHCGD